MYLSVVAYLILAIALLVVGAVVLVLGREQLARWQLARDKRRKHASHIARAQSRFKFLRPVPRL